MASNWQQQLANALAQPKAAELWQLMHELRDHLLHTPTSWYACVQQALTNSSTDSTKAFIAVLQVLRLSLVLRFQPSTQLSLMAACATQFVAIKTPTNSVWRELRIQLRTPVREQAELTRLAAFALHCSAQLCNGESERSSWQQWLLKYPHGASWSWSWCAQLIEQSSATLAAEAELIPASSTPWYGQPLTSADSADDEARLQQQQNFMAPLLDNYRRSLKLQAPRKLLQALRDYGAGNGQLTPLINAISKRPGLVSALQAEASQNKPSAAAMGLKQSLLRLGPKRVAPIVANTLLHEQLTNYHGPYHHQLLSYNQLFQQLLRTFLASTATSRQSSLKIPVPLFCMVWNAGLFRHTKDFAHLRLSVPDTIPSWHSCHWFQPANNTASYRQLSEQIASRWQLSADAISQVNTEHINNSISAAVVLASAGVWACFAPHSEPLPAAKGCFRDSLKLMNMKEKSWRARVQTEIAKQSAQCCWPRF